MPHRRERVVPKMGGQIVPLGSEHAHVGRVEPSFEGPALLGLPLVLGVFCVMSRVVIVGVRVATASSLEELVEHIVC